jgi:pimeloyl-ACP methyl ester carboxylesterase
MGEHGKYVNTPQTAADMNSILDAVGQQDMVFWGFSYGTILGQTYAAMFPDRSKRVIIDGVANQFQWYEAHIPDMDYVDTTKVIDGFFDECVKAGDDCALSPFGKTAGDLKEKLSSTVRRLRYEPLAVYKSPSTYGLIDMNNLWIDGFFRATYAPKGWPKFAQTLANLLNGNATDALLAFTFSTFAKINGDSTDVVTLNDGISGAKYWGQGQEAYLDKMLPYYRNFSIATTVNRQYGAKQQWLIPRTHSYVPRGGVKTAHPLLILSTTYDPVCALAGAKTANEAFVDSRLVEVKAFGHCSLAMPSLCVARHVRAFLEQGTMPAPGATCEIDVPYFKKRGTLETRAVTDDERVLEAQGRIADGMLWVRG